MQRKSGRKESRRIAFCGMMAALGTVLMMLGGLFPLSTYCVPLAAGLLLWVILPEYGRVYAWLVWAVTMALTLILGADKEAAFFYLFLGWYPIVKPVIDRIPSRPAVIALKCGIFLVMICAMYAFLCFVLRLDAVLADFQGTALWLNLLFPVLFVPVMLLYDRLLVIFAGYYINKLRPKLKRFL